MTSQVSEMKYVQVSHSDSLEYIKSNVATVLKRLSKMTSNTAFRHGRGTGMHVYSHKMSTLQMTTLIKVSDNNFSFTVSVQLSNYLTVTRMV